MARARNIKPGIMENETLADLSHSHRLLFIYLWMLADREGRLEDRPKRIRVQAFPYDDVDVEAMLDDLNVKGFILRYTSAAKDIIQVMNFSKHQAPHVREKASDLPSPEQGTAKVVPSTVQGSACASPRSPDSLILRSSDSLIPDSLIPEEKPLPVAAAPAPTNVQVLQPKTAKAKTESQMANANTWDAYADAYYDRYGVAPVRNAKVNGQVAQLVQRLGADEAPQVAAFYVLINDSFYIRSSHEFGLLVSRAEGIRTQWVTNRQMNGTTAQQIERKQANLQAGQEAAKRIMSREGRKENEFL
ncbi:hypothetical protein [Pseudomonas sp.]|uniref:hypothetical protein n=1 Tax=Pseudomonas sp. TaxID=306 RepID=UPI003FD80170